jgi:hypothetical protein
MQAYHIDTTVSKEGFPLLPKLPLREGQHVSVTIELTNGAEKPKRSFPLRGLPHKYVDPFEPAAPPEDWAWNQSFTRGSQKSSFLGSYSGQTESNGRM